MSRKIAFVFAIFIGLLASPAAMATCSWTTLTNGTTADASQVMNNFDCLAPLASPSFTGNVGIGTSTPTAPFEVYEGYGSLFYGAGGGFGGGQSIISSVSDAVSGGSYSFINAESSYSGTPVQAFNVSSQGVVAAGDSVYGPGSRAPYYTFNTDYGTGMDLPSAGSHTITFRNNYTETMRITSSGAVGIGTNSPSYTFHVNGSVAGTSAYNNLSDVRLKKNIRPIDNALATISQIHGVRFQWRSLSERMVGKAFNLPVNAPQIGFIAQDLKKILPEAVTVASGPDAVMSVEESKVVPVLVEAVKELKAVNNNQAAEIQQLKTQMTALERKVAVRTASNIR